MSATARALFSSFARSTQPTLPPYYSVWSHENLTCLRHVRLVMLFQTYISNFTDVFWTYRPSCLVLAAAHPKTPPNLPFRCSTAPSRSAYLQRSSLYKIYSIV